MEALALYGIEFGHSASTVWSMGWEQVWRSLLYTGDTGGHFEPALPYLRSTTVLFSRKKVPNIGEVRMCGEVYIKWIVINIADITFGNHEIMLEDCTKIAINMAQDNFLLHLIKNSNEPETY